MSEVPLYSKSRMPAALGPYTERWIYVLEQRTFLGAVCVLISE